MNKNIFRLFFALIFSLFLSINFGFAQNDVYQNVSSGFNNSSTTVISNTSTGGLADTARYVGMMIAAAIITLVIFKIIQGAVLKGTFDNIYDQQKGNNIIKNAVSAFLIFIFINLLFGYINPDYGSWIFNSSTRVEKSSSINCSPITPKLTAYSPQTNNSNGNIGMEGGQSSSVAGIDGKSVVRTLEDVRTGKSTYVTLAGDSAVYKNKYTIPSITYTDKKGQTHTLTNVTAYVHDTGDAFKSAGYSHFDIAIESNMDTASLNKQPFTNSSITLNPQDCTLPSFGGASYTSLYGNNLERCKLINSIKPSDLVDLRTYGISCTSNNSCLIKKEVAENLKNLDAAYYAKFKTHISIASAYRSDSQQADTCRSVSGTLCAKPCSQGGGGSNHSFGDAVDFSSETVGNCSKTGSCNNPKFNWLKDANGGGRFNLFNKLTDDNPHFSLTGK